MLNDLKERREFPLYAESIYKREDCHVSQGHGEVSEEFFKEFVSFKKKLDSLYVNGLITNLKGKIEKSVKAILEASKQRIMWADKCLESAKDVAVFDDKNNLDKVKTTQNFKEKNLDSNCPALWDEEFAETPILNVILQELKYSRQLLALSQDWDHPQDLKTLKPTIPLLKGEFYDGIPQKIEKLEPTELLDIDKTKQELEKEKKEAEEKRKIEEAEKSKQIEKEEKE